MERARRAMARLLAAYPSMSIKRLEYMAVQFAQFDPAYFEALRTAGMPEV
jgi:hypothetical protein